MIKVGITIKLPAELAGLLQAASKAGGKTPDKIVTDAIMSYFAGGQPCIGKLFPLRLAQSRPSARL